MAQGIIQFDVPSSNALTTGSRGVQHGIIREAAVFLPGTFVNASQVYAHLYITNGRETEDDAIISLCAGYVRPNQPITWSGTYRVAGNELVVLTARATTTVSIRGTFYVDLEPLK